MPINEFYNMEIHIGEIVKNILDKKKMKKSEFASQMNYSRQNINSLLKKDDWTVKQIQNASIILGENLFLYFTPSEKEKELKKILLFSNKNIRIYVECEEDVASIFN